MTRKALLLVIILMQLLPQLSAQIIRGKVIDSENQKAIPFATIKVLQAQDSTLITGIVTRESGDFIFDLQEHKAALPLLLHVSYLGFESQYASINQLDGNIVTLRPKSTMLQEATIVAQRPTHKMIAGGIATDITGTALSKLPTIYGVFKGLPLLEVQGEQVKVTGHGTPLIYINGRKMRSSTELDRIQPALIEKIELLTSPGAGYDASVQSVIRITTKRIQGAGLSGQFSETLGRYVSKDNKLEHYTIGSLTYRTGAWDLTAEASYRHYEDNKKITGAFIGKADGETWTNTIGGLSMTTKDQLHFNGEMTYTTARTSFGVSYAHDLIPKETELLVNNYTSSINGATPIPLSNRNDSKEPASQTIQPNAYLIQQIGDTWQLSVDASYYRDFKEPNVKHIQEGTGGDSKYYTSYQNTHNSTWGVRAEVEGKVLGGQLTLGTEWIGTDRKDSYTPDPALHLPNNDTRLQSQYRAIFANHAMMLGKTFSLSMGLRLENAVSSYYDKGVLIQEQSRNYTHLFPSLALSGLIGKVQTQVAITSQIVRPVYWQLRSDYIYLSRFEYQTGNPNLIPERDYSLRAMATYKWTTVMVTVLHRRDPMVQRTERMPDLQQPSKYLPYTTLLRNVNYPPMTQYQVMSILSPRFTYWQPQWVIGTFWTRGVQQYNFDRLVHLNRPMLFVRSNNSFTLPHDLYLNLNATYFAFGDTDVVSAIGPSFNHDLSITKLWLGGALSTTLEVVNPFNIRADKWLMTSQYTNLVVSNHYPPHVMATVTYKFNTTKRKYRGRSAIEKEIRRF